MNTGFQSAGAQFLDLVNIRHEPGEHTEDLFQRLIAFFEDNLLTVGCSVTRQCDATDIDEDVSPPLENTIVYLWLQLINPDPPLLVKPRYGAELRTLSLASLKPEISQALPLISLQDELRTIEDTRAMRIGDGFKYNCISS